MKSFNKMRRLLHWVLFLFSMSACEETPKKEETRAGSDRDTTVSTESQNTEPGLDIPFHESSEIVEADKAVTQPGVLRAVRSAPHTTYERVTFEFGENRLPGYRVEYVDGPVHQCGSGREVEMMAPVLLHIRFNDAQAHTPRGEATIENRHRRLDFETAKELKLICDFEGNVDWLLGLTAQRPYRVFELNDPARLVVDVSRL